MAENDQFNLREAERRIANLMMIGTVVEVQAAAARAIVKIGDLQTGALPWVSPRAGLQSVWAAPKVGEQVIVISHNGDPAQGVIVGSLFSAAERAVSDNPRVFRTEYDDGTFVEYNLDTQELTVDSAGSVLVKARKNIEATADQDVLATAGGKIKASAAGDIQATAGGEISATAGGDVAVEAGGSVKAAATVAIDFESPTFKVTGMPDFSMGATGVILGMMGQTAVVTKGVVTSISGSVSVPEEE